MRDEDHRELTVLRQGGEQVQDLCLHRHVERADRLIGDQELRLDRQGARDRHALRCPPESSRGRRAHRLGTSPHGFKEVGDQCGLLLAPVHESMHPSRLADRLVDSETRVQRRVRVLVDQLHPASDESAGPAQFAPNTSSAAEAPRLNPVRPDRTMHRARVVLPLPDSPTSPRTSRAPTSRLTPSSATILLVATRFSAAPIVCRTGNVFVTSRTVRRSVMVGFKRTDTPSRGPASACRGSSAPSHTPVERTRKRDANGQPRTTSARSGRFPAIVASCARSTFGRRVGIVASSSRV